MPGSEKLIVGLLLLLVGTWTACGPASPEPIALEEPAYFVKMGIPGDNPMTKEGVELGRMLFFDPILSADSTISCGHCHVPSMAFADGKKLSVGVEGRIGLRNAMSLGNVGYKYKGLFWDGRATDLEDQVIHPLTDSREMASDWETAEKRINDHPRYPSLFREAFRLSEEQVVGRTEIEWALAQFQRSLITANAKYDRVMQGEETFTEEEERGFQIFFDSAEDLPDAECGHCHLDPLFTNLAFENNGIEAVDNLYDFPDQGRGRITARRYDRGKFRVPSLRNVGLTAPYMHDGRFATLEEVVDHYTSGGHQAVNKSPNVRPLALNAEHKEALVAFLHTLTDSSFITNPAFQNPFE